MKRNLRLHLMLLLAVLAAACGNDADPCSGSNCPGDRGDAGTDHDPVTGGFTAHYYSEWERTYVHFNDGSGWTEERGKPMEAEGDGWFTYRHDTANEQGLELAFNDGADAWDNNAEQNYTTDLARAKLRSVRWSSTRYG